MTKHEILEKLIATYGSLLFTVGRMQNKTDERDVNRCCENLGECANNILTVLLNLVDEESK